MLPQTGAKVLKVGVSYTRQREITALLLVIGGFKN
jgi:hypothetical protein